MIMPQHLQWTTRLCVLAVFFPLGGAAAAEATDYLRVVRAYADAMIEHGRDVYGSEHSPLFAAALDRETLRLPSKQPPGVPGIREHDRATAGANPMHHENLYQVLYALSEVTGQPRYAREADKALAWFFEHCQSEATGLLAWGEHIRWDFRTEGPADKRHGMIHEYFRPWVLMPRCFELAPDAAERFARGVWLHQIADHKTGDFSRHARFDAHGPGRHNQYPRHGGFYIATWAEAYRRTEDPVFLTAIETVLGFYERHRSPTSGAIPAEIGNARSNGNMLWPSSNLSLAVDLWDGADKVPDPLAERMRASARKTDAAFLRLPHQLGPDGQGFITQGNAHRLAAEDVRGAGKPVYAGPWATGYGFGMEARAAALCAVRHRQVPEAGYRRLVLASADRYLTRDPPPEAVLYPATLAHAVWLMLDAERLTGEAKYLDRADHFADMAMQVLFTPGCPLPKASSHHDHYEAITRADTFVAALLRLWCRHNRPAAQRLLEFCDR